MITWSFRRGRKAFKFVLFTLFTVLLCLVFGEVLANVWFAGTHGGFFYTRDRVDSDEFDEVATPAAKWVNTFHPYFGFSEETGNNHHFQYPEDYPLTKKSTNQYFIGVFGGSVAMHFSQEGRDKLVSELKKSAYFKEREIVVIPFSASSYRQPQQLLVLNYFLSLGQEFDAVINIDGFNDLVSPMRSNSGGVDISMPEMGVMATLQNLSDSATMSQETLEAYAHLKAHRGRLLKLNRFMGRQRFALSFLVAAQLHNFYLSRFNIAERAFRDLAARRSHDTLIYLIPAKTRYDNSTLYARCADLWERSSLAMNDLLVSRGIPYFHILQPNQYFSTRKFTPAERAEVIINNGEFMEPATNGYPRLIERIPRLRQRGELIFSAVDILNDEPSPVYSDNCCHLTAKGNEIFAEFIARSMLQSGRYPAK